MTIYYADPEKLAAPLRENLDYLLWSRFFPCVGPVLRRCASHHLLLLPDAGRDPRVRMLVSDLMGGDPEYPLAMSPTVANTNVPAAPLNDHGCPACMVANLHAHMRETTHPEFAGHSALIVREPQMLAGPNANMDSLSHCAGASPPTSSGPSGWPRPATSLQSAPGRYPKTLRHTLLRSAHAWHAGGIREERVPAKQTSPPETERKTA